MTLLIVVLYVNLSQSARQHFRPAAHSAHLNDHRQRPAIKNSNKLLNLLITGNLHSLSLPFRLLPRASPQPARGYNARQRPSLVPINSSCEITSVELNFTQLLSSLSDDVTCWASIEVLSSCSAARSRFHDDRWHLCCVASIIAIDWRRYQWAWHAETSCYSRWPIHANSLARQQVSIRRT